MPRIDFYIVSDESPDAAQRLACRLTEKVWRMGNRIYVHTDSPEATERLDRLMWTYRQDSFLPHGPIRANKDPEEALPVLIGHEADGPETCGDVLINLAGRVPDFYTRFKRVAEIVTQNDDADRAAGRERFRYYREHGNELESHNV